MAIYVNNPLTGSDILNTQLFMKKIKLTKGYSCLVDDEDFKILSKNRWYVMESRGNAYASGCINKKRYVKMHRFLMKPKNSNVVDHINHNTLDNRRGNLRICTRSQNSRNKTAWLKVKKKSKYKGVTFEKRCPLHPWRVRIKTNSGRIHIGYYATQIEAAKDYDRAAIQYHGEFAYTNLSKRSQ